MKNEVENNSLSQSKSGPKDLWPSVSNYYIQILPFEDFDEEPVINLYFLDSGGGSYPQVISNAQVEWFQRTAQQLNPHARYGYLLAWNNANMISYWLELVSLYDLKYVFKFKNNVLGAFCAGRRSLVNLELFSFES